MQFNSFNRWAFNRLTMFGTAAAISITAAIFMASSTATLAAPPSHAQGNPPSQAGGPSEAKARPPVLEMAGSFIVNGETITTNYSEPSGVPGRIVVNQMYVQFMIPVKKKPGAYPVVMEHGSGHTGKTYGETPDGREGWASYFSRNGYSV